MNQQDHTADTEPRSANPRRTAFVTGATGFLGLNLVRQLSEAGWEVIALHRPQSDLKYLQRFPVRRAVAAIEDRTALEQAVPAGVEVIFHTAADVSYWSGHKARQTRTNVDGTRNLVEVSLRRGVMKFVHTSSTGIYGLPRQPVDETAPHLGRGSRRRGGRGPPRRRDRTSRRRAARATAAPRPPAGSAATSCAGRRDRRCWPG